MLSRRSLLHASLVGAATVGPTDLTVQWGGTDSHGACQGPAVQGNDVIHILDGNDVQLTTDTSPAGGCVFSVAEPKIDLDEFSRFEVDVETSGNREAYGDKAGQWFSFWLYPPGYAYSHGIGESGEIDLVENLPHVRTNFAGCSHDCHETEWSQPSNAVKAHVTMLYDRVAERVNVYRCEHGADTCPLSGEVSYVDLSKMQVQKPYIYTLCIDVWYAQPGMNFQFTAKNLRILRDNSEGNSSTTQPATDTTTPMTTDPSGTTQSPSTTEPASSIPAPAPPSTGGKCGYDCSGGCETCKGFSNQEYCFSDTNCEGDCGGKWCPSTDPVTTEPQTTQFAPTTEFTTQVPPTTETTIEPQPTTPSAFTTETTTGAPPPEGDEYCPSAQDLVVAYGNGVVLKDQGWTVKGDAGAATKAAYNLNGGYVEYDIDVSNAKAGTIPNVYSIAPRGLGAEGFVKDKDYCDGADQHEYPWCVEVDWIESNGMCGGATTLHTIPGTGPDACNAWGCRTEYHNDAPKFHMRIDYDDAGRMTVSRDGRPIAAMDPAPQASNFDAIKQMHGSTGAVIYSSMWTGSWVPGPEDCGAGPGDVAGSSFTVSNLKIHGSVVQGPEPQWCSSPSPPPAQCEVFPNHEVDGDNLGDAGVTATTEDCCEKCRAETKCVGWTWAHEGGDCQLKGNIGEPRPTLVLMTTGKSKSSPPETTTTTTSSSTSTSSSTTPETTTTTSSTFTSGTSSRTSTVTATTSASITTTTLTTTVSSSMTTSTSTPPMTTTHSIPDSKKCRACNTMCSPCRECASLPSSKDGGCSKCWQCWDYDDDEKEDDEDECNALDHDHDWDDEEVQCLSEEVDDCRQCWEDVPLPTTTTTTQTAPSAKNCRACNTMCNECRSCVDSETGECEKCWRCWDYHDDEDEDDDDDCNALHKDHDWNDDEVQCLSRDGSDCRLCWSQEVFTV